MRARLTLLYFAVLAVSFIAFFWICDIGFQRSIETAVNDSSRTNLQTIERVLAGSEAKGGTVMSQALAELANLWANGALLEVANASGEWLYRSDPFLAQHPTLPADSEGGTEFLTTNLDFNQYRVAMARVHVGDQVYSIHAAVPTEPSTRRWIDSDSSRKKRCRSWSCSPHYSAIGSAENHWHRSIGSSERPSKSASTISRDASKSLSLVTNCVVSPRL